jgi:hypothetical protein
MMPDEKPQPTMDQPSKQVRTSEELRQKINEVRTRVEEAARPAGPLSIFHVTTSS